jgi:hypothetical protein
MWFRIRSSASRPALPDFVFCNSALPAPAAVITAERSPHLASRDFCGSGEESLLCSRHTKRPLPYEADALALQLFRRAEWSRETSLDAGTLRVEVCESSFYRVKFTELEAWLKRTGDAPREVFMRRTIQDKLAHTGNH